MSEVLSLALGVVAGFILGWTLRGTGRRKMTSTDIPSSAVVQLYAKRPRWDDTRDAGFPPDSAA